MSQQIFGMQNQQAREHTKFAKGGRSTNRLRAKLRGRVLRRKKDVAWTLPIFASQRQAGGANPLLLQVSAKASDQYTPHR
jgi:hypothetical protein